MEDLREAILEKSINFWIRFILRLMAWVVVLFYMIFRILKPIISNEIVKIDNTDIGVITVCIALLLAIEGVRAYAKRKLNKLD